MTLTKQIIYALWRWQKETIFRRKLKRLTSNTTPALLDSSFKNSYSKLWSPLAKNPLPEYPALYAGINGNLSPEYAPENTYYNRIEPTLNNKAFSAAYADKNFYEAYLKDFQSIFPKTILRGINGHFYDHLYRPVELLPYLQENIQTHVDYILKPSVETSGGNRLVLIAFKGNKFSIDGKEFEINKIRNYLINDYKGAFVLQERIQQHPWFSTLNETSVNTVRIYTYRSVTDNNVYPIQSIVRFGRKGSLVDNQAVGGLSTGISEGGNLNSFAVDKYGNKYDNISVINKVAGEKVPGLESMKGIAKSIAALYYYHRLLGFDFCFDTEGKVRLLEINCNNIEINFLQMNNGPLFGKFTDEVIEFCCINKRTVVFDFSI